MAPYHPQTVWAERLFVFSHAFVAVLEALSHSRDVFGNKKFSCWNESLCFLLFVVYLSGHTHQHEAVFLLSFVLKMSRNYIKTVKDLEVIPRMLFQELWLSFAELTGSLLMHYFSAADSVCVCVCMMFWKGSQLQWCWEQGAGREWSGKLTYVRHIRCFCASCAMQLMEEGLRLCSVCYQGDELISTFRTVGRSDRENLAHKYGLE